MQEVGLGPDRVGANDNDEGLLFFPSSYLQAEATHTRHIVAVLVTHRLSLNLNLALLFTHLISLLSSSLILHTITLCMTHFPQFRLYGDQRGDFLSFVPAEKLIESNLLLIAIHLPLQRVFQSRACSVGFQSTYPYLSNHNNEHCTGTISVLTGLPVFAFVVPRPRCALRCSCLFVFIGYIIFCN